MESSSTSCIGSVRQGSLERISIEGAEANSSSSSEGTKTTRKVMHTFQCRMEKETTSPNQCVANITDQEDGIMPMFSAALYASVRQINEGKIRKCIHDFRDIWGGIVILQEGR